MIITIQTPVEITEEHVGMTFIARGRMSLDGKKYYTEFLTKEIEKFGNTEVWPMGDKEKELAAKMKDILSNALTQIEEL